jgi:hypothetical protein
MPGEATIGTQTPRDFASLLDDLFNGPPAPEEQAPRPNIPFDYLSVAEELHSGRIRVSSEEASAEYRDVGSAFEAELANLFAQVNIDEQGSQPAAEPADAPLPPIEPEAIAAELGLNVPTALHDLGRLRREFAFQNHPDRVEPHLRQRALLRMQVANMLIDDAKRRALAAGRR